jgi:poly(3-hydroxybutyrate) depolymerase
MNLLRLGLLALLLPVVGLAQSLPPLPALGAKGPASVSGVSSGAYMAVQLHLAQGERFAGGVAAVAGGPWGCAQGAVLLALGPCLGRSPIAVAPLLAQAQALAATGALRLPPAGSPVYRFAGARDEVVAPATTQALRDFYAALRPAAPLQLRTEVPAAHGWVVKQGEGECARLAAPFLQPCGHDLAGELLAHLLGPLQPAGGEGRLLRFDQRAFHAGPDLAEAGFVFVPAACERDAAGCRVHVALHGCRMNEAAVGDAFARRSGLNEWAAANRLVVLYPQTGPGAVNACWDWWGYTGPGYLRAEAPQMKAIAAMVDRLSEKRP